MRFERSHLLLIAALIWGIPGIIIITKGVMAYAELCPFEWWLLAVTGAVLAAFYMIFRGVVARYSAHIDSQVTPCTIWSTFPLSGWLLILFMMGLGVSLRYIQGIPVEFFASFYSGLGPMLLLSAFRFLKRRSSVR